jgi:hypothetical protein
MRAEALLPETPVAFVIVSGVEVAMLIGGL